MAVGFKDGTVVTVKGNLTRDRLSTMKVVHSESTPGVYVTGELINSLPSLYTRTFTHHCQGNPGANDVKHCSSE